MKTLEKSMLGRERSSTKTGVRIPGLLEQNQRLV